jgi:hypothetical protein
MRTHPFLSVDIALENSRVSQGIRPKAFGGVLKQPNGDDL